MRKTALAQRQRLRSVHMEKCYLDRAGDPGVSELPRGHANMPIVTYLANFGLVHMNPGQ